MEQEYGQSTSLEVLNAEVDFKNDSINYLNTISNLSNVKRDLNLIMNVDSEKMYDLVTEVDFLNFDELNDAYKNAQENNTSLKIDDKNIAISKNEMYISFCIIYKWSRYLDLLQEQYLQYLKIYH